MSRKKVYGDSNEVKTSYTSLQKKVLNFFRSNSISILTGDPGTGKTYSACYYGLSLIKASAINKIIISKPIVEVGKSMGFLPGDLKEKTDVYMSSYISNIDKIGGEGRFRQLSNGGKVVFEPVNFVRGDTFENALVILDEAQGLTLHELITFVTRLSETSQLIIMGDPYQADIKNSGLIPFIKEIATGIDGIGHMELGDEYQMRHPMIVGLYKNYKKYLSL